MDSNSFSIPYQKNDRGICKILVLMILLSCISILNKGIYGVYSNLAVYINFIVLLCIVLINNRWKLKKEYFEYFVLLLYYSIFSLIINIDSGGIGSVITAITGFFSFVVCTSYRINRKYIKVITFVFFITSILLFINSNNYMQKYTLFPDEYINSNIIAATALYLTIFLNILIAESSIRFAKIISLALTLLGITTILNCQSRAPLLALISYLLMFFIMPKKLKNKRKFLELVLFIVILVGTLIPFIILIFYRRNIELTVPFISKSLYTGRELIWSQILDLLKQDPLSIFFGLGSQIENSAGELVGAHNSYMAIIVNFGVFGYILIYGFILFQFKRIIKFVELNKHQVKCFLGYISIFIHGFFEYTFLNPIFVIFTFLFLGLALNFSNTLVIKRENSNA